MRTPLSRRWAIGALAALACGFSRRDTPGEQGLANASTLFGANDGYWDVAANWSNGVPISTTSAIVSSTSGVPILPERTSAITKNLSGGGSIGLCPGGVNKLTIVTPTASYAMKFATVDTIEHEKTGTDTPRGHG